MYGTNHPTHKLWERRPDHGEEDGLSYFSPLLSIDKVWRIGLTMEIISSFLLIRYGGQA
jgi:hypothetical protein